MSHATSNDAPAADPTPQRPGAFDAQSVLRMLMRASGPRLSDAELQWLIEEAPVYAGEVAERAAETAMGVACLVQSDGAQEPPAAGNFQSGSDVCDLLMHFADVFRHIDGLIGLGTEAQWLLRDRVSAQAACAAALQVQ